MPDLENKVIDMSYDKVNLRFNYRILENFYNLNDFQDLWVCDLIEMAGEFIDLGTMYTDCLKKDNKSLSEYLSKFFKYIKKDTRSQSEHMSEYFNFDISEYTEPLISTLFPVTVEGIKRLKSDGLYGNRGNDFGIKLTQIAGGVSDTQGVKVSLLYLLSTEAVKGDEFKLFTSTIKDIDKEYKDLCFKYHEILEPTIKQSQNIKITKHPNAVNNGLNIIGNMHMCKILGITKHLRNIFTTEKGPKYLNPVADTTNVHKLYNELLNVSSNAELFNFLQDDFKELSYDIYPLLAPCTTLGEYGRKDERYLHREDMSLLTVEGLTRLRVLNNLMEELNNDKDFYKEVSEISTRKERLNKINIDIRYDSSYRIPSYLYSNDTCGSSESDDTYDLDSVGSYDGPIKNDYTTIRKAMQNNPTCNIRECMDYKTGFITPGFSRSLLNSYSGVSYALYSDGKTTHLPKLEIMTGRSKKSAYEKIEDLSSKWFISAMTYYYYHNDSYSSNNTSFHKLKTKDKIRIADYSLSIMAQKEILRFLELSKPVIAMLKFIEVKSLLDNNNEGWIKELKAEVTASYSNLLRISFRFNYYLTTRLLYQRYNDMFSMKNIETTLLYQDNLSKLYEDHKDMGMDISNVSIIKDYKETTKYAEIYKLGVFRENTERTFDMDTELGNYMSTKVIWPYTPRLREVLNGNRYEGSTGITRSILNNIDKACDEISFLGKIIN